MRSSRASRGTRRHAKAVVAGLLRSGGASGRRALRSWGGRSDDAAYCSRALWGAACLPLPLARPLALALHASSVLHACLGLPCHGLCRSHTCIIVENVL